MHTTRISVDDPQAMRELGRRIARRMTGGEVILLSGPLGAGKTTFAQGFGQGLGIEEPIVSPTFTIARELPGVFADGTPARLIHVDAYRLGGGAYAPGQDDVDRLLDELESLGLDEELEDPREGTVILMEWGEQMGAALADERLDIAIERPRRVRRDDDALSSAGTRVVTLTPIGARWDAFVETPVFDGTGRRPEPDDETGPLRHSREGQPCAH